MTLEERVASIEETLKQGEQSNIRDEIQKMITRLFFDEKIPVTVSSEPIAIPTKFNEQFVIYKSGTDRRLYVYVAGAGWKYVTLT